MENPKIRFKGFTKDWEQRKLGDLVDRVTRKNQDLVSELPLTISAQYGLIDQNEFFDKRVASKDVSGYYLIENGEFAYNKSTSTDAPWGAIKRLDRYENGVLSTLYIVFGIKENNPVDSDFLVSYYSTNLWHKGIHEIAAEGARNHGLLNIAPADFFETRLMIPQDIEEQKKIGKYFIELEALITLHQRKCEQTKNLKKYMLQKMFPQNGAKVPEIRFNGFTHDWEQRKLSELLEKYEDPVETPHDGYERVGIRSHAKGTFHSFVEPGKELDTAKMYRVAADKFILNITFAWEHAVAITDNNDAGKLVSHRFPQFSFNPKLKPHFFKYLMLDKKFREHLELSSPGGAGRNRVLKISDMLKYEIKLPSIEEQIKIGEYFDSLDNLITLHQRQCDELKKMKKYMLQNMFI
ncbi:restriction endonuclease subunit S [[Eubacterium] rectale]|uniref:Restriction endonuclease subunit S n=1 Tax=Agathobacter rectalis TaxID=39491 RepID=A0AAW4UFY7_9FIRM|nr:restriction endonuclease subunit S [Agathobacter rectalis]MCB6943344.1 restriction endonuclease subunit S [Agathobacter rectalis]MCB6959985.1 restriction endonuclease subunit S [Agathobacter rectalis]